MNIRIIDIDRYGDLVLEDKDLLNIFNYGDILEVSINNNKIEVPLCKSLTDVLPGSPTFYIENNKIKLGILNGDFASTYALANYYIQDDEVKWNILIDNIKVNILKDNGYIKILDLMHFQRTNNRKDYQSDEIFSNFRRINNNLYRSSSPIDNSLNRSKYVDELIGHNNIKTIINLTNSNNVIEEITDINSNYYKIYKNGNILALNSNTDLKSETFRKQISEGLKFIINHDGPFLIHCLDGKDRTGFVIFLLMGLLNYTLEEINEEYLKTYEYYYHIKKDSDKYDYLKKNALNYFLRCINYKDDIKEAVKDYLLLNEEEINKLELKLSI